SGLAPISEVLNLTACRFSPFTIEMEGTGGFPNIDRPRIIWYGIKNNEYLMMLQQEVEKGLEKIGFPVESRKFKPHLTIGRLKDSRRAGSLPDVIRKMADRPGISQEVESFFLMRSQLLPWGAKYTCIEKYELEKRDT
ncbi:MAG: RNA 2',3'-cyclic phosphodiesterase, partial [Candidatus Eremiobacteraeota bacterium]|nr:RNA 2',3'-cyclic phosphodiesterase [Candidatus Eremiobacteraeota bacterium]